MTLIEGILFSSVLIVFVFGVVWLAEQVATCSICCNCGCKTARTVMVVGEYDALEETRLRELLTENCPNCRHRRTNPQSTIDSRRGGCHVS